MDDKTLNGLSASLTLLQIQLNAVLSLLQAQYPTVPMRDLFCRTVEEGVELVGPQTMQQFRDRLRQDIVFQNLWDMGLDDLWTPGEVQSDK
jgi:hypothetical protein